MILPSEAFSYWLRRDVRSVLKIFFASFMPLVCWLGFSLSSLSVHVVCAQLLTTRKCSLVMIVSALSCTAVNVIEAPTSRSWAGTAPPSSVRLRAEFTEFFHAIVEFFFLSSLLWAVWEQNFVWVSSKVQLHFFLNSAAAKFTQHDNMFVELNVFPSSSRSLGSNIKQQQQQCTQFS